MNEGLLMEVVRMLHEREAYFDKAWIKAADARQMTSAATFFEKASAYSVARQMLMAALTDNKEVLQQYDLYHKED